jgi:hypothetical protein
MQKALEIAKAYIILIRQRNKRRQIVFTYKPIIMSSQRIDFEGWNWNE